MIVIGISGPSCSGKSTLVQNLEKKLKKKAIFLPDDILVIHQDDFYKLEADIPKSETFPDLQDWDSPEAFKMEEMKNQIINFKKEKKSKILIVEGICLFQDEIIRKELNSFIWLECQYEILKERRAKRDESGTESYKDPPEYFDKIVWPTYLKYHNLENYEKVLNPLLVLKSESNKEELLNRSYQFIRKNFLEKKSTQRRRKF